MIAAPVEFDDGETRRISDLVKSDEFESDSWSRKDLDDIRAKIKKHYIDIQGYRCCYCQMAILTEHGRAWDVEHVIARSTERKFMFEPRNLSVSCIECNQAKGSVEVTAGKTRGFPAQSERYKIVHPHFDNWEDHIDVVGEATYFALTPKGKFTIYFCDLFRFREREAKVRAPIRDKRFERDVGELRFAKTPEQAEPIIASILARIQIESCKKQTG